MSLVYQFLCNQEGVAGWRQSEAGPGGLPRWLCPPFPTPGVSERARACRPHYSPIWDENTQVTHLRRLVTGDVTWVICWPSVHIRSSVACSMPGPVLGLGLRDGKTQTLFSRGSRWQQVCKDTWPMDVVQVGGIRGGAATAWGCGCPQRWASPVSRKAGGRPAGTPAPAPASCCPGLALGLWKVCSGFLNPTLGPFSLVPPISSDPLSLVTGTG